MKSRHQDWIEERVDAIQNEIWERQGKAVRSGNYESASDLAIWEDVFAKFMEDLEDLFDATAEARWDRQQEKDQFYAHSDK